MFTSKCLAHFLCHQTYGTSSQHIHWLEVERLSRLVPPGANPYHYYSSEGHLLYKTFIHLRGAIYYNEYLLLLPCNPSRSDCLARTFPLTYTQRGRSMPAPVLHKANSYATLLSFVARPFTHEEVVHLFFASIYICSLTWTLSPTYHALEEANYLPQGACLP